jgi:hypothetical protein
MIHRFFPSQDEKAALISRKNAKYLQARVETSQPNVILWWIALQETRAEI